MDEDLMDMIDMFAEHVMDEHKCCYDTMTHMMDEHNRAPDPAIDSALVVPGHSVSGSVGGSGVCSRGGVGRAYGRWIEWMHGWFHGWADGCMDGMDGSMMLIAVLNLPLEDIKVVRIIRGPMNLHPKLRHNLR